jgi:hypothetical protein
MKEIIDSAKPNSDKALPETNLKVTTVKGVNGREIELFVPTTKKGAKIIAEMDKAGEIDTTISFGDVRNGADKNKAPNKL